MYLPVGLKPAGVLPRSYLPNGTGGPPAPEAPFVFVAGERRANTPTGARRASDLAGVREEQTLTGARLK